MATWLSGVWIGGRIGTEIRPQTRMAEKKEISVLSGAEAGAITPPAAALLSASSTALASPPTTTASALSLQSKVQPYSDVMKTPTRIMIVPKTLIRQGDSPSVAHAKSIVKTGQR